MAGKESQLGRRHYSLVVPVGESNAWRIRESSKEDRQKGPRDWRSKSGRAAVRTPAGPVRVRSSMYGAEKSCACRERGRRERDGRCLAPLVLPPPRAPQPSPASQDGSRQRHPILPHHALPCPIPPPLPLLLHLQLPRLPHLARPLLLSHQMLSLRHRTRRRYQREL